MLNPVKEFEDFLAAQTPEGYENDPKQIDELRKHWMDQFIQRNGRQGDRSYNAQVRTQLEIAVPSAKAFPQRYIKPRQGVDVAGNETVEAPKGPFEALPASPFLTAEAPANSPFGAAPRAQPTNLPTKVEDLAPVKRNGLAIRTIETAKDTTVATAGGFARGLFALGEFAGDAVNLGEKVVTLNHFGQGETISQEGESLGYGVGLGRKTSQFFEWLGGATKSTQTYLYSDELKEDQRIAAERLKERGFRSAAAYYITKPHLLAELAGSSIGQAGAVAVTTVATGGTGLVAKGGQLVSGASKLGANKISMAKGFGNLTSKPIVARTINHTKQAAPYAAVWAAQLSRMEGNEAYGVVKEMDIAELRDTAGYNEARAMLRRRHGREPTEDQIREVAARTVEGQTEKFSGVATFAAMLLPGGAFFERSLGRAASAIPTAGLGGAASAARAGLTEGAEGLVRVQGRERWKRALAAAAGESLSEGVEELGQFAATEGAINSLVSGRGALGEQVRALGSEEGRDVALLGAAAGGLFGGLLGARRDSYTKFAQAVDKDIQYDANKGQAAKARRFTATVDAFNQYMTTEPDVDPRVQAATVYAEGERALNILGLNRDQQAINYLMERAYGDRNLEKPRTGTVPVHAPLGDITREDMEEAHDNDPEIRQAINMQHGRVQTMAEQLYSVELPAESRFGTDALHHSWARQVPNTVYSNADWGVVLSEGGVLTRVDRATGERTDLEGSDPTAQAILAGEALATDVRSQTSEDLALNEAVTQGTAINLDYTGDFPAPSPFGPGIASAPSVAPELALQVDPVYEPGGDLNGGVEAVKILSPEAIRAADSVIQSENGRSQIIYLDPVQLANIAAQDHIETAGGRGELPRSSQGTALATQRKLAQGEKLKTIPTVGTGVLEGDTVNGQLDMETLGLLKGIHAANQQAINNGTEPPYIAVPVLVKGNSQEGNFNILSQTNTEAQGFEADWPTTLKLGDAYVPFPVQRLDLNVPEDIGDPNYEIFVPEPRPLNIGSSPSVLAGTIERIAISNLGLSDFDLASMDLQLKAEAINTQKEKPLTRQEAEAHLRKRRMFSMPGMPTLEVVQSASETSQSTMGAVSYVTDANGNKRVVVVADRTDNLVDLDYQLNIQLGANNLLQDLIGLQRMNTVHTALQTASDATIKAVYERVDTRHEGLSSAVRSDIAVRALLALEQDNMRKHREKNAKRKKPRPYVPSKGMQAFADTLRSELESDGYIAEGATYAEIIRGFTPLFGLTTAEQDVLRNENSIGRSMSYRAEGGGPIDGNMPSGRRLRGEDFTLRAYSVRDKGDRELIYTALRSGQIPAIQEFQFAFGGKVAVERVQRFLDSAGIETDFLNDYSTLRSRVRQQRDVNYGRNIAPIHKAVSDLLHRGVQDGDGNTLVAALKTMPRYEGSGGYQTLRDDIHYLAVMRHAAERNDMLRLTRVILKKEHHKEMEALMEDIHTGRRSRDAVLADLRALTVDENVDWAKTSKKFGVKAEGKGRAAAEKRDRRARRVVRELSGVSDAEASAALELRRSRDPEATEAIESQILPLIYAARQAELDINGRQVYGDRGLRMIEFYGWQNAVPLRNGEESFSDVTNRPHYDPSTRGVRTADGRSGRNDGQSGRVQDLYDIIAAVENDVETASIRSTANEFYRRLYETGMSSVTAQRAMNMSEVHKDMSARYNAAAGEYEVPNLSKTPGMFVWFENGSSTQFEIKDDNLRDGLMELWKTWLPRKTDDQIVNAGVSVLKNIGRFTRLKGSMVTKYNPFFIGPNLFRDVSNTIALNYAEDKDLGKRVAGHLASQTMMRETWKLHQARPEDRDVIYAEWEKSGDERLKFLAERYREGGPANFAVIFDRVQENVTPDRAEFRVGGDTGSGILPNRIRDAAGRSELWIANAHNAMDNYHRNAMYVARRQGGEKAKTAARNANELIDWGQQSAAGQGLSHFFMFSQPTMTGAHAMFWRWMWRDFTPPVEFDFQSDGQAVPYIDLRKNWDKLNIPLVSLVASVSATAYLTRRLALPAAAFAILGDDEADDRVKDIPDYVWASNIATIPVANDTQFVLPAQYGPMQLINAATVLSTRVLMGDTTLESASDAMADVMMTNLSPINVGAGGDGAAAQVVNTVTPDILKTFGQLAQNTNAFGSPIKSSNPFGSTFASDAAFHGTPEGWVRLSENIRQITGRDWAPESLRHVAQSELGPVGQIMVRLMELTDAKTRDTGAWLRAQPFVRVDRSGEYSEARHLSEQVKRLDEYKMVRSARKRYDATRGTDTKATFERRNPAYADAMRAHNRFLRERKALRQAVDIAAYNISQQGPTPDNRMAMQKSLHDLRRATQAAAEELEALMNRQPHVRLR